MRHFRKIILLIGLFIFCVSFNSLATEDSKNTQASPRPFENYNIVLIFIDTLRADHLSCYGYFRKTSPNIDQLAKKSVVFEQNFSTVSFTNASFMSIITSLYPKSHGVIEIYKDKLSPRVKTLAKILQMYGYKTAWFGPSNEPHLDPKVGFGRGFDDVFDAFVVSDKRVDKLRTSLCDWLQRNKDRKFFLNFHTYKVHAPYLPSLKYKERFTKERKENIIETREEYESGLSDAIKKALPEVLYDKKGRIREYLGDGLAAEFIASGLLSVDLSDRKEQKKIEDFFSSRKKLMRLSMIQDYYAYWRTINFADPSVNAYIQTLYDAGILEFDEEVIGPVIEKLKSLNIYDRTIIIVCADHGEEFYEHNGYSHGPTLYKEVTYVPLIIRVPWVNREKRIKELSQNVDIMPTLLDLLGIPIPHGAQGKSWVDFINNKKALPLHKYLLLQHPTITSIRSKEWDFILNSSGKRELYRLTTDPKEQQNIYSKHQDIAFVLETILEHWEASLPSYRDQEYSYPPEIDKETQERIRKTGYW